MQFYDDATIQQHYQMTDAIQDIKLLLKELNHVSHTERLVIPTGEGSQSMLYMPSIHFGKQMGMIKITSITPQNPTANRPTTQANIVITNIQTGEHIATIDASYLTRLRTGALSAIATEYLSRENAQTLGMIGTGGMAYEQLWGNIEVRNIQNVILYNRTYEKAIQFQKYIQDRFPHLNVLVSDNVNDLVVQSDIINCQTQSTQPVFNAKDIQKGTHINGIGSYRPDMVEIDYQILPNASHVVFDDIDGVKKEAGEFIKANEEKIFCFEDVYGNLKSLIESSDLARSEDDITVFKSVGASYYDLAVALGAYHCLQTSIE
ncbi:ornithine cyclodeaminase family protein [Staphylococcus felis]|uniref:ornithine cyclodeaminase family protein n=1 Tax=Staphylococcus felis TaxID=46127 RepID=UPI000CD1E2BE|nr:ornithine cyclodeaminase [Staphylococcus felis]AVP37307.1 ornithine cyclodeaminase [Staphylococcus felis]PNZ36591.1 ornithine cyclodeaminase [Staphylococcus felis]QQB02744.1 ornithine cyclodeaminase family protein [Staphylococcus felis]REH80535.1 ornithine cyclodeaminase family protein [Staphylococcus felis]REH93537.1 ornithine cyclodeaminase family protein [Staphylococcus felis]